MIAIDKEFPKKCEDCPCYDDFLKYCRVSKSQLIDFPVESKKPDWCMLNQGEKIKELFSKINANIKEMCEALDTVAVNSLRLEAVLHALSGEDV